MCPPLSALTSINTGISKRMTKSVPKQTTNMGSGLVACLIPLTLTHKWMDGSPQMTQLTLHALQENEQIIDNTNYFNGFIISDISITDNTIFQWFHQIR